MSNFVALTDEEERQIEARLESKNLTPAEKAIYTYIRKEGRLFSRISAIGGILAALGISSCVDSYFTPSPVEYVSMPQTNIVLIVYKDKQQEKFYNYNGSFRTAEAIEASIRETGKKQLETVIQKEIEDVIPFEERK